MKNWYNATFAPDRWKVQRIVHTFYGANKVAWKSRLMLQNRYNGRVKTVVLDGHWEPADFPDNTYTP